MDEYVTKAEHLEFSKRVEDHNRRTDARIGELEEGQKKQMDILIAINNLTHNTKQMAETQVRQEKKIDGISERIEKVENRPMETWWSMKSAIIGAVGTAIGSGLIFMLIEALGR